MKIVIIGGTGVLGSAVSSLLSANNDVISVGNSKGRLQCDFRSKDSLHALFSSIDSIDALIVTAGTVCFLPLEDLCIEDFESSLQDKLLGQINAVLVGREYLNPKGSFTLTSGIAASRSFLHATTASIANSGVERFVEVAALELSQRINCVSPTLLCESAKKYGHLFPGLTPLPAAEAARAYQESVEGDDTGKVFHAF